MHSDVSATERKRITAENNRRDRTIGWLLREWETEARTPEARHAAELIRQAIWQSVDNPDTAAEYLRLAALEMNRAVGWQA